MHHPVRPIRTATASAALLVLVLAACSREPAKVAVDTTTAAAPPAPTRPDAQMQAVLDQLAALGGKPIETLSADEARKQPTPADAVKALLTSQGKPTAPEAVASVTNRTIPGSGGAIPVRIYTPTGTGPFPVIVYYHGGGWVIATIDTYDASARALANAAGAVVVAVEYRKAPEHPFPAGHQDAFDAYQWVVNHANEVKGDANKIAVVGESAGGNMAASVSIMARDRKVRMPVYQVLIYPVVNADTNTPSMVENATTRPLNKAMMIWFATKTLQKPADMTDPRFDILDVPSLSGLPATTMIMAQIDPLRSGGEAFASKLKSAGVKVDTKTYGGVTHEFFGMGAVLDKAKAAVQQAAQGLKSGFNSSASDTTKPRT